MIEEAIFNVIKDDAVLSAKVSAGGGVFHIYPLRVPEGVEIERAITYSLLTDPLTYPALKKTRYQISCLAKTFTDARGMANDVERLFNDLSEVLLGGQVGVKYVKYEGRFYQWDKDAKLFHSAVEISIKH